MQLALERIVADLKAAVGLLDRKAVDALSGALIAHIHRSAEPLPLPIAKGVLNDLRRKRFFGPMQRVADALLQASQDAPLIRRLYVQALIDQGALTAARTVLRELVADTYGDPVEHAEARGLLGRTCKQRYVDAWRHAGGFGPPVPSRYADVLREAVKWYHGPYLESPASNFWHGINAVACAARARRDGVLADALPDSGTIASDVLAMVKARKSSAGAWELATAMEACVALDDEDGAIAWAVRYIQHPDADAFEIGSTLRQLEEVWGLVATAGIGRLILPLLRGALLQRENGAIEVTAAEVRMAAAEGARTDSAAAAGLEKVFGTDAFTSYETYVAGARRARTVARVGREVGGRGEGTGFLMCGSDLADRYRDVPWLFITNAHVISTDQTHKALTPDEAVITFQALSPGSAQQARTYEVDEVLHVSGPQELDCTVVTLKPPVTDLTPDDRCDVAKALPVNNQKGRVYIIGHPGGGGLSFSIHDNLLLDYEEPKLHYRTPTEGGSSGSPVYNAQWKLIGLHHAGTNEMPRLRGQAGTYEANEGIWIQSIRRALA